jgi:hypothetical protein
MSVDSTAFEWKDVDDGPKDIQHLEIEMTDGEGRVLHRTRVLLYGTWSRALCEGTRSLRAYRSLTDEDPGDRDSFQGVNASVKQLGPVSDVVRNRVLETAAFEGEE